MPGAIQAGVKAISCEVHMGSRSEALAYALSANLKHNGIRYTNADKRRAVGLALADPELSGKTDEVIGQLCGVSHRTVTRRREEFYLDNVQVEQPQVKVGANGKHYPVRPRKPKPTTDIQPTPHPADLPDPNEQSDPQSQASEPTATWAETRKKIDESLYTRIALRRSPPVK